MRFIVDECTGPAVANWLRQQQHDVYSVYDQARGAVDEVVLAQSVAEDRILITNDKDFGEKVFRDHSPHKGIVFLRLDDERTANKIAVLEKLLAGHADKLLGNFVVVTDRTARIRTSP
jgi:predicted nuclease of predicted toxin-antitoxin system